MEDLWAAIGIMFIIEGAIYALFPAGMKRTIFMVLQMPPKQIRTGGLIACAIGLSIVWLVRSL